MGKKLGREGILAQLRRKLAFNRPKRMQVDFKGDGLGVKNKNLSFLSDPKFIQAWDEASRLNREGWSKTGIGVPDIRWRAHVCCWAARQALTLDGDFVECGVHTGLLSLTVCNYVNFASLPRHFWLFDTYNGVPLSRVMEEEQGHVQQLNDLIYFDVYEYASRNFKPFPNAKLVRGTLPESFAEVQIDRIAYLSIDMNNANAERESIEAIWPRLVAGAVVVIDDYAFARCEEQYAMWNRFAQAHEKMVLTVPTGQGLLIK